MLLAMMAQSALGCETAGSGPAVYFEPDPDDAAPPAAPELVDVLVERGSTGIGCGAGYGTVVISVERPEGDPDTHEGLGYRLAAAGGSSPFELDPFVAGTLFGGPDISLRWYDGGIADHEPIDVTLAVFAVDAGGNESEPLLVDVTHEGSGCGCATGSPGTGVGLVWLGLAALRRARRPA